MFAKVLTARSETQVLCIQINLWSLSARVKTYVGLTASNSHTDQKQMEPTKKQNAGSKIPLLFLVQSGLSEKWWREALECFCYLLNIHDKLADMKKDLALHLMVQ